MSTRTKIACCFQKQQEVYNTVFEGVHRRLLEPELIQKVEVPDPVQIPKISTPEKRVGPGESPFLLKPKSAAEPATASGTAAATISGPAASPAAEPPALQEAHNEDYFIRKMRERVMAYHNRSSSAEVSDRNGIFRPQKQEERIRESVRYAAEQMDLFEENFLKRDIRAEYRLIGQVFDTYWLVQYQDSLYIIDQHAAHERVLYERTLKGMKNREFTSQYLSPPIILSLTMQEAELLNENMDRFARIGFEIEPFGGEEYAVRAVPDNLFGIAKKDLLMEMIDDLADGINTSMTPELIDEKVASMSCKAAVKGNSRLSAQEVDELIAELLTLDNPYHCPHGRPTIIAMTRKELEKKFKRIV